MSNDTTFVEELILIVKDPRAFSKAFYENEDLKALIRAGLLLLCAVGILSLVDQGQTIPGTETRPTMHLKLFEPHVLLMHEATISVFQAILWFFVFKLFSQRDDISYFKCIAFSLLLSSLLLLVRLPAEAVQHVALYGGNFELRKGWLPLLLTFASLGYVLLYICPIMVCTLSDRNYITSLVIFSIAGLSSALMSRALFGDFYFLPYEVT